MRAMHERTQACAICLVTGPPLASLRGGAYPTKYMAQQLWGIHMRWIYSALVALTATSAAFAQTWPALRACAAEADNTRRLACYDKEMARQPPSEPMHATVPSAQAAAPGLAPAEAFGLSEEERARRLQTQEGVADVKKLTAHITKLSTLPNGRQRITLDNAQVWEQTEEDYGFAPQVGATATITRGMMSGFWMATDAYRQVRVKRIH